MIQIKNVCKTYNDSQTQVKVFDGLNVEIHDGKFTSILGRSGCGKTTLLNLIGSLDRPDSGNIIVDEVDVSVLSVKEIQRYRNTKIGFVFQSFILEPNLTALDNICLPLAIKGVSKNDRYAMAVEMLKLVGLESKEKEIVKHLSGGEQQRVCIARALINNPSIVLADEPTGHLDYENGQVVMGLLKSIADKGKTVILVTHNEEDAYKYSDYILRMKDGRISEELVNETD